MIIAVDRTTGIVQDVGQRYDARFFDNIMVPDGTIPQADPPRKYFVTASGAVQRRPLADLMAEFPDEYKASRIQFILNQINAAATLADVKDCLKLVLREALR